VQAITGLILDSGTSRGCVLLGQAANRVFVRDPTDAQLARVRAALPALRISAAAPAVRVQRACLALDTATRVALAALLDGCAPVDAARLRALPPLTDGATVAAARDAVDALQATHGVAPPGETIIERSDRLFGNPLLLGLRTLETALKRLADAIEETHVLDQVGYLMMATSNAFAVLADHDIDVALDTWEAMLAMGAAS
jgi:hypothetical protein